MCKDPTARCLLTLKTAEHKQPTSHIVSEILVPSLRAIAICRLSNSLRRRLSPHSQHAGLCIGGGPRDLDKLDLTGFSSYEFRSSSAKEARRSPMPKVPNELKSALYDCNRNNLTWDVSYHSENCTKRIHNESRKSFCGLETMDLFVLAVILAPDEGGVETSWKCAGGTDADTAIGNDGAQMLVKLL
ncbi:hypothetical protein TNCV_734711 [Trichonephila clavipes]|nr:hypothetical protein TNCV_734711 [Trichonephila clavipes]